jgi:hypothetical protein
MLQKIEASLGRLIAQPSISAERMAWATRQARLFFGSFRKADADNPEAFSAGCLRLFTSYDPDVVQYVVDPITGIPGRSVWLPSLSEVKSALDARADELLRAGHRASAEEATIAARRKWLEERAKPRPTLEELKAKHGPNWGLPVAKEGEKAKADRLAKLTEANGRLLKQECEAAGMSSDSPISPSLAALMKAGTA